MTFRFHGLGSHRSKSGDPIQDQTGYFFCSATSITYLLYLICSSKVSEEFERSVLIVGMPPLE